MDFFQWLSWRPKRLENIFERWGAHVSVRSANATAVDFESALREADIVHISAHANYDRILLADGPFTTENLSALNLAACRCRLLVLSACEAGDLNPHSPDDGLISPTLASIQI
jgi:CHAT domain-containing protein